MRSIRIALLRIRRSVKLMGWATPFLISVYTSQQVSLRTIQLELLLTLMSASRAEFFSLSSANTADTAFSLAARSTCTYSSGGVPITTAINVPGVKRWLTVKGNVTVCVRAKFRHY